MVNVNKIFFSVVIIGVFFWGIMLFGSSVLDKKVIPASFILSENMGFGHTPGELVFGAIQENQSASRVVELSNTFDREIEISIESSGEIVDNIIVSENNFKLSPLESKNITFIIYTSGLTEYKEYSGKIIILSKKV